MPAPELHYLPSRGTAQRAQGFQEVYLNIVQVCQGTCASEDSPRV